MLLAGLGRTHALTSQRLGLLQLHDNLLRRVLRDLPHGRPFCPATSSRDYSEQPSHNKRSEKPRPLHEHSSKREDLDPNYTPNYEEPVMSVGLELVVVRVLSKERPCIILRHDAECDTGFSEKVYLALPS